MDRDRKLARLDAPDLDAREAAELIAELVETPQLNVDITEDGPRYVARCRGVTATGRSADAAMIALAPNVASAIHKATAVEQARKARR